MAIEDVDAAFVDAISNSKYATRTADTPVFETLRGIQSDTYLNTNTNFLPEKKYNMGLALLILHHYALDDTQQPDSGGSDGMTGPLTGESVGDVSMSYGGVSFNSASGVDGWKQWLMLTRWGAQFVYLMRTFKSTPLVT
jgi:hypothetical protein